MKRLELLFTFLQLPLDYLMLILAGVTAYNLRFTKFVISIRPILFDLPWSRYWPTLLVVALGWIVIFAFSGLYSANPNRKFASELTRIVMACSTSFAAITIYVFFTLQKFDSRFLVLTGWLLAMLYVFIGRLIMRGIKGLLYRAGIGLRATVIIGQESVAKIIIDTLKAKPYLGYKVVGNFERFTGLAEDDMRKKSPDEIIFTDPKADEEEAFKAIDFANQHHVVFKYSADLFDTISTNMAVSTVAGIPIIELRRTRLTGWGKIAKRLVDIVGAIILLVLLSPLFLIISIIILLETGLPIIYRNERVGQFGKNFFTLKFRSMYHKYSTGEQFGAAGKKALREEERLIETSNGKSGPVYKIKNDPRVTSVGAFLRHWSLDELPQFWNVLKGQMSLVGPRPHQPREVNKYEKRHHVLFAIKPGLTGLAQISGRSNLTFEEEARLDTFYIENWNLLLDLIVLIKTPFIVLKRKGAW